MCTVTLSLNADELILTMNRDEQRSRGPEFPPALQPDGSFYPVDSATGGTWIGVNQPGVAACLLNNYRAAEKMQKPQQPLSSRGLIIPEVLAHGEAEACLKFLATAFNPTQYSPFNIILATNQGAFEASWDAVSPFILKPLNTADGMIMRTTSSWNSEAVCAWRAERFAEWKAESNAVNHRVLDFHRLQQPSKKQWSPLMSRTETSTRSITQMLLSFRNSQAELTYWPQPHDRTLSPQRRIYPLQFFNPPIKRSSIG